MLAMALELACPGLVWLAVRACLPSEEYHQHLLEWYMRFKDKRQKQGDAQSRANGGLGGGRSRREANESEDGGSAAADASSPAA